MLSKIALLSPPFYLDLTAKTGIELSALFFKHRLDHKRPKENLSSPKSTIIVVYSFLFLNTKIVVFS
jgi:hypothetical protein